jgi:glycolate oxidase iron-sulfur subunit
VRTGFTEAQRADPAIGEADGILRACVHCGFCAPSCPTYRITGDELDGPRGRIWLIRDMLESDAPPRPEAVRHIDRCLGCLACLPACPSGVDYRHLVELARERIEARGRRPLADRALRAILARMLPDAERARLLFALARPLAMLAPVLPGRLGAALALAGSAPPAGKPGPAPGIYPAEGARRGRVGVLAGCVQAALAPGINAALIRLLNRAGIEVVVFERAKCCGAIDQHLGRGADARARARAAVAAIAAEMEAGGLDAVVQTAAGCGTLMKDYGHLLAADPEWAARAGTVGQRVRDAGEYLLGLDLPFRSDLPALSLAWQAPCSLTFGQGAAAAPRALLEGAGFAVAEPADAGMCCGSAGTYNVLEPGLAGELRARKAASLDALGADAVVTANIGCLAQLRGAVAAPVLHFVEVLDWAAGGPVPETVRSLTGDG